MMILNCGIGLLTLPVGSVLFIGSMHDSGSPTHILRSAAEAFGCRPLRECWLYHDRGQQNVPYRVELFERKHISMVLQCKY